MTKEEIKQKISVIISSETSGNNKLNSVLLLIEDLKVEEYQRGFMDCYEQSNTVGLEVQKRAFEAGRKRITHPDWDYVYETFEDYLKHLENDNNKSVLSE